MSDLVIEGMGNFDFESLGLYQKSLKFINLAYEQSNCFPKDEMYGLSSQYRRAATSIALNIGEGYGESIPLSLRYLRISRGSIRECVVCVTIAFERKYLTKDQYKESRNMLLELSKMSSGYRKYLENKRK